MANEHSAPVAVIGANSPIGLTVIRELGERGLKVIAFGKSDTSISRNSRHTAYFEKLKRPLAEHLPEQLAKHGVRAVFAISENDLAELALRHQLPMAQLRRAVLALVDDEASSRSDASPPLQP